MSGYIAGVDTDKTINLAPENADPLILISSDEDTCKRPAASNSDTGSLVTFQFNYPIEIGDPDSAEELDDGVSIVSPDVGDPAVNTM